MVTNHYFVSVPVVVNTGVERAVFPKEYWGPSWGCRKPDEPLTEVLCNVLFENLEFWFIK